MSVIDYNTHTYTHKNMVSVTIFCVVVCRKLHTQSTKWFCKSGRGERH